jgi:hypothetical protein
MDMDVLFAAQSKREDLIDCGCNTHARRYFVKAHDSGDDRALLVLGGFKRLYPIEDEFKDATDEQRLEARQSQSKPAYQKIVDWCRARRDTEPPASKIGRAIAYLLKHQVALWRFIGDGAIPIDNTMVERSFVNVALTRKNFLFLGADTGGDWAAIIYSVLASGRHAGVDEVEYLTDVLTILSGPDGDKVEIATLLPAAWKRTRQRQ